MKTDDLMNEFERRMIVQRYSPISIQNYKSAVGSFLQLAEKKYSHSSAGEWYGYQVYPGITRTQIGEYDRDLYARYRRCAIKN